ncbi:hypothetical protein [Chromobacterium haemolyticum]|uniref:CIS tube protein n=1 Tax=Chromobacterium haemolyticum TaxID=394935 RepID=UPI002449EC1C|nr:hypothetical protein [Chromobacterium haemolyticum]MDH0342423.1 hypothetical protein [Chromobacterium haemolyticum]
MGLLERGLAKLKLEAFDKSSGGKSEGVFEAMYNPASVQFDYAANYQESAALNKNEQHALFSKVSPPTLRLDLVLDGRAPGRRGSVDDQLKALRNLCFAVGQKGEPPYLRITWGNMSWHGQGFFKGRCQRLGVSYTLFDRSAKPLRAMASLSLLGESTDGGSAFEAKASGKLKSVAKVVSGYALPLVGAATSFGVGLGTNYLTAAVDNDLDNLRDIQPGQSLVLGE